MTRMGLATSIVACLPVGVMEQIMEIWESRTTCHMDLEFKDGRCLEIKTTTAESKRFGSEDFDTALDSIVPVP